MVRERTGLSRSSIYLRISEGRFPRPISLGERAVGWLESEITEWLNRKDRGQPPRRASRGRFQMTGRVLEPLLTGPSGTGTGERRREDVLLSSPAHEDRKPSCSVHLESGKWFCHGCGEGRRAW